MRLLRAIFLVFTLILVCIGIAILTGFFLRIPVQVEKTFGPPSDQLSLTLKYRLIANLYLNRNTLTQPSNPSGSELSFLIELGEPTSTVITRLGQAGLIPDPQAFRSYLIYTGLDTNLQAGNYKLSPAMSPLEIAAQLQDPTPSEVYFPILPGWRMEEIAASLPTSGLEFNPEAFLLVAQTFPIGYSFSKDLPPHASHEGFLLADTYLVSRDSTAKQLVDLMIDNFEKQVDQRIRTGFTEQGLNMYEAITLASIVEKESLINQEKPLIASVFINRLSLGMKLETDPTVQYALGFDQAWGTWWKNPLFLNDLNVDSPYNTYRNFGLPPGPIANPGISSITAVAFPAESSFLYFRATCDDSGEHVFSTTFQEHQQKACP